MRTGSTGVARLEFFCIGSRGTRSDRSCGPGGNQRWTEPLQVRHRDAPLITGGVKPSHGFATAQQPPVAGVFGALAEVSCRSSGLSGSAGPVEAAARLGTAVEASDPRGAWSV